MPAMEGGSLCELDKELMALRLKKNAIAEHAELMQQRIVESIDANMGRNCDPACCRQQHRESDRT